MELFSFIVIARRLSGTGRLVLWGLMEPFLMGMPEEVAEVAEEWSLSVEQLCLIRDILHFLV